MQTYIYIKIFNIYKTSDKTVDNLTVASSYFIANILWLSSTRTFLFWIPLKIHHKNFNKYI